LSQRFFKYYIKNLSLIIQKVAVSSSAVPSEDQFSIYATTV